MGEYFNSWQRKTGFATLLIALVMSGAWIRSLMILDCIEIPIGQRMSIILVTDRQFFALFAEFDPDFDSSLSSAKWFNLPTSQLTSTDHLGMTYDSMRLILKYRNHPPVAAKGPHQPYRFPKLNQDYWLIGLPLNYLYAILLSLISFWMLLSKPRISIPLKNREPNTNDGK